jgi:hypothetical protein
MRTYLISFFFLLTTLLSCKSNIINITVYNKTDYKVAPLIVYVQGKEYYIQSIKPRDKTILKIKIAELSLSKHDFRIETNHKNKDSITVAGFYYSDLSGNPNMNYTIELQDSKTLIN